MQIHNLKRKTPNTKSQSVGRGGKRGKTSGRGTKGQNARAGRKKRPELRDFIKRIPKLRGRGKNINTSIQTKPVPVNLKVLETAYKAGDAVNPKTLVEKKIISTISGKTPIVKILATGDITKALSISGCEFSAEARTKIEKAGGTIN